MKHEINHDNIWQFQRENNISRKDINLLMEAYRRKHLLNPEPNKRFLGLGMPSQYKSKFFICADGSETAKVLNWYTLSNEGKEIMLKIEKYFGIPINDKKIQETNSFLFDTRF